LLKHEVLNILEQKIGTLVTGGQLANSLSVSRNAIWKSIHALIEDGVQIVSVANVGYKLLDTNDTLSEHRISSKLSTSFVGKHLTILPSVHSTNQYLKEIDSESIENGFVVIANEQTQGRGRRSREFVSARDEGIYMSILLKINGKQRDIRLLTICVAVAVSKAIENICKLNAEIKWVNDIYCNGKKICGILTEAILSVELQELDTVIIGAGINTGNVPFEIKKFATSIREENGMCGIRNELIAEVLNQFEKAYLDYVENDKLDEIIEHYDSKLFIKGKKVIVATTESEYIATVLGVDNTGALIVEAKNKEVQHIATGEIKLK
jgi:birA, biotin-[acetyl-CoA-carboxylase] ligase region